MLDFNKIRYFYVAKLWTKEQVADAVTAGVITAEQYYQIVKKPYTESI
ncbi:XkdX family protein [Lysinibacillus halotolerans]|uniref:XkdX family protein n=1 Tax=Lysinibacillus halotolerans TaxID=1368476 RepID=A0A3M8H5Z8_9BACI|nr:XkdX family protein [Lysinibacillus halotolerans]RNC97838.1 XkdX family protein [Lysinibacillus halotolerans]